MFQNWLTNKFLSYVCSIMQQVASKALLFEYQLIVVCLEYEYLLKTRKKIQYVSNYRLSCYFVFAIAIATFIKYDSHYF